MDERMRKVVELHSKCTNNYLRESKRLRAALEAAKRDIKPMALIKDKNARILARLVITAAIDAALKGDHQ